MAKKMFTNHQVIWAIALTTGLVILILFLVLSRNDSKHGKQVQSNESLPVENKTVDSNDQAAAISQNSPTELNKKPESAAPPDSMVWIEGGTFMMGSENEDDDEKPAHQVTVNGFYMERTEVTNSQYDACVKAGKCSPAHFDDTSVFVVRNKSKWKKGIVGLKFRDPRQPVVAVTWKQADSYCRWKGGRLPTEAEWEYACSAGRTTENHWESDSKDEFAWYNKNSDNRTHLVGQKKPNNLGLFDMKGNVWEWCSDWYGKTYYQESPSQNPQGPDSGNRRVLRGGSWISDGNSLRCAYRYRHEPEFCNNLLGFRCVR